ncbi:Gastric triacylglycerol lipase, partial [Tetrabaena socialis]
MRLPPRLSMALALALALAATGPQGVQGMARALPPGDPRRIFLAVVPPGPQLPLPSGGAGLPAANSSPAPPQQLPPPPYRPPSQQQGGPGAPKPPAGAGGAAPPPPGVNITVLEGGDEGDDAPPPPPLFGSAAGVEGGNGTEPRVVVPDLIGPLLSGDVTGLLFFFPPNQRAPGVSSYAAKIDDMIGPVVSRGYPIEQHQVITNDGYKLQTFRIPYGRTGGLPGPGRKRPPVLLIHGISLASTCWVVNEASQSLGFILADRGYDVWMMNTRGNTFAREHVTLKDTQSAFWDFAMDEMALVDFQETLKYVQDTTGMDKIGVVGHSQGATLPLMALSVNPWLAEGISVLVALGPCVYVKYMKSVILGQFCEQANKTNAFRFLPAQELLYMDAQIQQTYLAGICQVPGSLMTCLIFNEPTPRFFKRRYGAEVGELAVALPVRLIITYPFPLLLLLLSLLQYDLTKVTVPVVMVSGGNDVLASPLDIAEQKKRLRKVLKSEHEIGIYSHM